MDKNVKTALIIGGIIIGLLLILSVVPGWGGWGNWGMMGPGMRDGFGFGGGLLGILWIVILGVVIWAIVAGTTGGIHHADASSGDTPLEILKKRYARGEIGKEDYEARKQDLI